MLVKLMHQVMTDILLDDIEAMQRKCYSSNDEWSEEALKSDNQRVRLNLHWSTILFSINVCV